MQHILLIRQEATQSILLAQSLRDAGYGVHIATTGEGALALAREHTPDLAILALQSLDREWEAVLESLHTADTNLHILVVAERLNATDIIAVFNAGADDCTTWPRTLAVLLARIRALLRRRGRL